ncbi:NADPH:quinone oxidoreductase family protein [Ilumatobacteraceae bacterium]|nr:NADPH:quinone oxidoreductase family protein [Ilumatobacteraceae bacterium]
MRALSVTDLTGPNGLAFTELDEPADDSSGVLIDMVFGGVSFPDLLQTKGMYQIRPDPPFTPGVEGSGIVRSAPPGSGFSAGDRVAVWGMGVHAEVYNARPEQLFVLPPTMSLAEGAAFVLNYQTAMFCAVDRGGLSAGESILVLGAAGGVGTSAIQVARGVGAGPIIGLVSTPAKAEVALAAGADHAVLVSDTWKDEVLALTGGRGVDMTYDPVGGDRFLDGLRCLARGGRLVVVGFAAGEIPTVKVNRLLLRNISVVGAAWGEAAAANPGLALDIHQRLLPMVDAGVIKPPIGEVFPFDRAVEAFTSLDDRTATAKVLIAIRPDLADQ